MPRFDPVGIVITLDPIELVDVARDRVTRGPTATECATYGIDPCPTLENFRSGGL